MWACSVNMRLSISIGVAALNFNHVVDLFVMLRDCISVGDFKLMFVDLRILSESVCACCIHVCLATCFCSFLKCPIYILLVCIDGVRMFLCQRFVFLILWCIFSEFCLLYVIAIMICKLATVI